MQRLICTAILSSLAALGLVLPGGARARSRPVEGGAEREAAPVAGTAGYQAHTSSLQLVGQVGGRTEDVAAQGDPSAGSGQAHAYVAVGLRLVVLDVSEPITPTELGSTTPFPDFAMGVTVSGSIAYVAAGMAGLRVVDVSTPTAPIELGFYDTPGYAEGVTVAGSYAYVADGHYGLRIVDVSDPTNTVEAGYAYPLNYVFDVAVDGEYAYLAAAGAGLLVVDVSDPAHPEELGSYDTPGYAYGLDVADGVAYVADGWEHLRVIDVSNPSGPQEVGSFETPGWSFGVTVSATVAYVADAFAGLQVVDVSDPANPVGLGGEPVSRWHAGRVVVVGGTAYVADRNRGLRVVDVSDPSAPSQVGFYGPMGYATAVAASGDHAYVAAGAYGLRVVDVSDPRSPVESGSYENMGYAIAVAVAGDHAYVAGSMLEAGTGLHVVDVSDPARPIGVGVCAALGNPRDLVLAGGMVYIADEWGLHLIDVSLPYSPTTAGHIDLQGEEWNATSGVAVSGTLAYVAQDAEGLRILDVSDPTAPTLLSTFKDPEWVKGYGVAVTGTTAYVTHHGGDGLKIVDVSDPLHPTQLGAYGGPGLAERLSVVSNTVYVAFGGTGVHAIDVTHPSSPTLASHYDTMGYAIAAAVVGDLIYIADGDGGLAILEMAGEKSPVGERAWGRSASAVAAPVGGAASQPALRLLNDRKPPIPSIRPGQGVQNTRPPEHQSDAVPASGTYRIEDTCSVTSTADIGPGTLRACLDSAVSGHTILFEPEVFPPAAPATITLHSGLWIGQGSITLDGSNAGVILDGSQQDGSLTLASDGNVVMGLQVVNFPWACISICCGAQYNVIGGNRSRGSGPTGEGNVVNGSGVSGIHIGDTGTMHNVVVGNLIGTDASGTLAVPNAWDGVSIENGASFNRIGGPETWERNIIAGNSGSGVTLNSYIGNTMGNEVIGNFIGTDITGMIDLGNEWTGVNLESGPFYNTVKGNLVSGSNWGGIAVGDPGTSYNTVIGNLIGTDASGIRGLGNRLFGVGVGESFNRVGGIAPGEGNVIGGNPQGIAVQGSRNLILGNFVGSNLTGTGAISNAVGIFSCCASSHNTIGGMTPGEGNLVSGNARDGIVLGGVERIFVLGNAIGTNPDGVRSLPNGQAGMYIEATGHTVIQGNLIAGNEERGVAIGEGSDFTHLRANHIGVAADGTSPLPNGSDGVSISSASITVGGTHAEDGNIIAFSGGDGVQVWAYPGNTVRRNAIYANTGFGIGLYNGGNNMLAAPIISGVTASGVSGTACTGCTIELFSDEEDEGHVYEGTTIADSSGHWTWSGSPAGPFLTATATDQAGNTSAFSAPWIVLQHQAYLPLVLRR